MNRHDLPKWARNPTHEIDLDPDDWAAFSRLSHQALDDILDYQAGVRGRPVWRPLPDDTRKFLRQPVSEEPEPLARVYKDFKQHVLPYPTGNIHPRFWSWVSGTGSPLGMLAEMLAAGMNSINLGFDEAASTHVELQVIDWLKSLLGLAEESSGLLVSGASMANLVGLAVARNTQAGYDLRRFGVGHADHPRPAVYASTETHSSVRKAIELLGLGTESLRYVDVDADFRINLRALERRVAEDRRNGWNPIAVVANAGTVNTGAIDPLVAIADLCEMENLWLHVDGAFGAAARLSPKHADKLEGLERADSLAFDLHKWMSQPYDIGCVLVRHPDAHKATFSVIPSYIRSLAGGVASGPINFSEYGVQLSRSFRALKVWMTFRTFGAARFRRLIEQNVSQARYLSARVEDSNRLELLAPTELNIVNFRYVRRNLGEDFLNELNEKLLLRLQSDGIAAPSSTVINNKFSIRVAIVNHRSRRSDFDLLIKSCERLGDELSGEIKAA
ncbi:MAG: pyridoxal-dependent decarboxylase [Gammaproteobacteria bacterium]